VSVLIALPQFAQHPFRILVQGWSMTAVMRMFAAVPIYIL